MAAHNPRARDGIITTWENEHGELLSVHRRGPLLATLREIAADVLAADDTFRLVSYSTPETILWELRHGMRFTNTGDGRRALRLPEYYVMSRAGLMHLLHPRLRSRDNSEAEHRRIYGGKA